MASDSEVAPLMVGLRGTHGVQLQYVPQNKPVEFFNSNQKMDSRFMLFSPFGRYMVCHTPTGVQLTDILNKETLDLGPGTVLVRDAAFSPQEGYLVLWDAPAKKEDNSCTVYDLKTRTVKALYSQSETTWKVRWSNDEQLLFLMGKEQTYVFDDPEFNTPVNLPKARIGELSISPASKPYHVIVFNPSKSTPGFVRLYRYPNIDDPGTALAARSVMKEDQVVFKWNQQGTHVLFLASADMDEKSYYGSSSLFLMNTSCDSLVIGLDQEGPVHAWEWNPQGQNFCVIYGYMPGKTCIFNRKGDMVHTFGASQYRNGILYNPFGNLLVLYGHGNIRGAFEVWDMTATKKVCSQDAEYMTYIEWSPDGAHLLMATTSPRLKVGNKYQVWHYNGKQLLDYPYNGELFQAAFRGSPPGTHKPPDPSTELGNNYVPNEPKKAAAYVPPSMRNRGGIVGLAPEAGASVHFAAHNMDNSGGSHHMRSDGGRLPIPGLNLQDEEAKKKKRKKPKPRSDGEVENAEQGSSVPRSAPQNIRGGSAGYDQQGQGYRQHMGSPHQQHMGSPHQGSSPHSYPRRPSFPRRPSLKTQENARVRSGISESQGGPRPNQSSSGEKKPSQPRPKQDNAPKPSASPELVESDGDENHHISSGDPEKDKKASRIKKKLAEINALKGEQASGKMLEKNQLEKIRRENALVKELENLHLSAILKKK